MAINVAVLTEILVLTALLLDGRVESAEDSDCSLVDCMPVGCSDPWCLQCAPGEVFDSTEKKGGKPLAFRLGDKQVIVGIEQVVSHRAGKG